jgi:hypothetical protein
MAADGEKENDGAQDRSTEQGAFGRGKSHPVGERFGRDKKRRGEEPREPRVKIAGGQSERGAAHDPGLNAARDARSVGGRCQARTV